MDGVSRQYQKWFSPHLQREMELLIFGHDGPRVIVFPTRCGRFFDYENFGMAGALREILESGGLQLFCVDSIDEESLYCAEKTSRERVLRHIRYEQYILYEVLPFSRQQNEHPKVIAHGCSLGAYHALNIALRHPYLFRKVVSLSGRYDLTVSIGDFAALLDDPSDPNVYFHTPTLFVPNITDKRLLRALHDMEIIIVVGSDDPFIENTLALSRALSDKKINHEVFTWSGRAHSARYWREMVRLYL